MALFWKRTKKQEETTPTIETPETPQNNEQIEPPATEQKAGFFQKLFKGQSTETQTNLETTPIQQTLDTTPVETSPIVRAPEQEKKSLWERLGWGQKKEGEAAVATAQIPKPVSEEAEKQSRFQRWKASLNRTSENLMGRLEDVIRGKKVIDAEVLDSLEEALIGADIGVQTALEIIEKARKQVDRKEVNNFEELKRIIKDELLDILRGTKTRGVKSETEVSSDIRPYVMMIVGVNGVGKTTTIGKLTNRIKAEGNEVLICAADTFRAAASDQLAIWAERTGVHLIQQKKGTDPAAVLFDSLAAAKSRNADVLIVDTAGRLHNKSNLMSELEKMKRVAAREVVGAPHEVLLVVDAVTGQNGLEQARQFTKTVPVTGIVLTKLDGTAKGGIVVAIAKDLGIPIRYVGIGEGINDLVEFSSEDYVNSLFD
ncbi:MAG: signal recognition particle-docking protein FtsY [Acidobacteria bacterium]|nr:signal recognition particle-docking protein FtsY [Acidobacteriota bacterium]